jgi:hypothetical protein
MAADVPSAGNGERKSVLRVAATVAAAVGLVALSVCVCFMTLGARKCIPRARVHCVPRWCRAVFEDGCCAHPDAVKCGR